MRECNFQTAWHHYLEAHQPNQQEVYELKLCKLNGFSFSNVKEHQIAGLLAAKQGLFHKISDSPIFAGQKTRFTAKKPFDCMWIKADAYVCIMYYIPRRRKQVVRIDIETFLQIKSYSKKKSITFAEILELRDRYNDQQLLVINLGRD